MVIEYTSIAVLITTIAAALSSVLHVCFSSRCTRISIMGGIISCDRNVPDIVESEDIEESEDAENVAIKN